MQIYIHKQKKQIKKPYDFNLKYIYNSQTLFRSICICFSMELIQKERRVKVFALTRRLAVII